MQEHAANDENDEKSDDLSANPCKPVAQVTFFRCGI